jgi:glutathione S-transferase
MAKVYGDYSTGNCYKIKLILHLLDQPYEWIAVDIL